MINQSILSISLDTIHIVMKLSMFIYEMLGEKVSTYIYIYIYVCVCVCVCELHYLLNYYNINHKY